jgi:hypothetical protein
MGILIEKLVSGNVLFRNIPSTDLNRMFDPKNSRIEWLNDADQTLQIYENNVIALSFPIAQITRTKLVDSDSVAVGTAAELFSLLFTTFFANGNGLNAGGNAFPVGIVPTVEDFIQSELVGALRGSIIVFDFDSAGTGSSTAVTSLTALNLDGVTSKNRQGIGQISIDGLTGDYVNLVSKWATTIIADEKTNFSITWDLQIGGDVIDIDAETADIIIGYSTVYDNTGDAFYVRPPKNDGLTGETDTLKFVVAEGGAESLVLDSGITYDGANASRGWFQCGITLSNGKLTFMANDGTSEAKQTINDFFTEYPFLDGAQLFKIITLIQDIEATVPVPRSISYDRHTEIFGNNFA